MNGQDYTKSNEGFSLKAYPDPITHADPWTIAWGYTGPEVHEGLIWDMAQCQAAFLRKYDAAQFAAKELAPRLSGARSDVITDLAYNMGEHRLSAFVQFLHYCDKGLWADAAHDLRFNTAYGYEVPNRAHRNGQCLITGVLA
jgi:GH24 family phage-related lysozyme (muramidase)